MPLADPGLDQTDIRRRLGQLQPGVRTFLEEASKKYFGLTLDAYATRVGYLTAMDTLANLHDPTRKAAAGSSSNPWDDPLANDAAIQKLFAQADAKARSEAAKAQAEQDRRLREDLKWEMRYGQFAMPFDVSKHINTVVKRKGNMSMLLNLVYADKRFKKTFPGILDKSGDLKMSIGEYNETRIFARSQFDGAGISITDAQFGDLVAKNIKPEQIAERAQIAGFIRGNADLLGAVKSQVNEMNAARKAKGLPPLQGLNSMSDIAKYVTKQKSSELYSTYEGGVIAAAAKRAGLTVSGGRARELGKGAPGLEDFGDAQKKFKQVADRLRVAGVELGAFGLTQNDLETIEFGGAGQAELSAKAEQALGNLAAQQEHELSGAESQLKGGRIITGETREGAL